MAEQRIQEHLQSPMQAATHRRVGWANQRGQGANDARCQLAVAPIRI